MSVDKPSTKIRVLVVDDEPLARRNLSVLLRRDPAIGFLGECGSGADAIKKTRGTRPDLIFLDVQMPECDGFDVIELLGDDLPPAVVFVTAHDDYALRAFEAGALDYLLKPFDDARFYLALNRAKERLAQSAELRLRHRERLVIKSAGQVVFLNVSEIDWVEAADYYACLYVGEKTHLLRRSLSELERALDPRRFCRIHRSVIVNLDRIRGLDLGVNGEYEVVLTSNVRLRLSRRFRKILRDRLDVASQGVG